MKRSAVIAVTPEIALAIQDEAVLETLSVRLRKVIKGNKGKGNKKVTINAEQNTVMDLRGTDEELQEALMKWTTGITILGVWNPRTGKEVGIEEEVTYIEGAIPDPVVIPAVDIVPSTYTKNRVVKEDFTYLDEDQVEQTGKHRVIKAVEYVRGEVKDFEGNIIKEGKKNVLFNGNVIATISINQLEADGTYIHQPDAPVTVQRTQIGAPTYPTQKARLLESMQDWVTYDKDTGNETGRGRPTKYLPQTKYLGEADRETV